MHAWIHLLHPLMSTIRRHMPYEILVCYQFLYTRAFDGNNVMGKSVSQFPSAICCFPYQFTIFVLQPKLREFTKIAHAESIFCFLVCCFFFFFGLHYAFRLGTDWRHCFGVALFVWVVLIKTWDGFKLKSLSVFAAAATPADAVFDSVTLRTSQKQYPQFYVVDCNADVLRVYRLCDRMCESVWDFNERRAAYVNNTQMLTLRMRISSHQAEHYLCE